MQLPSFGQTLWLLFSAALAVTMAWRGKRKGSLSTSGAVAAVVSGLLHMSAGLPWGCTLISFYLSGSKLTHVGERRKQQLDEGHKPGGQRNAVQVLSNSLGGCVAAWLYLLLHHLDSGGCVPLQNQAASELTAGSTQQHRVWTRIRLWLCTAEAGAGFDSLQVPHLHLKKGMVACAAAFLGHYACCSADTWASELGILSATAPRLITAPWRRVPPGTNGGVTPTGLAASLGGALLVAVTWLVSCAAVRALGLHHTSPYILLLGGTGPGELAMPARSMLFVLGMCCACGLCGSLLDSLLGALLQFSGWHESKRVVVNRPGPQVKRVSGSDVLSNDGVNALAAGMSALLAAAAAVWWAQPEQ